MKSSTLIYHINRLKYVTDPTLIAESGNRIIGRLQELLEKIQKELTIIGSAIDTYYKQHIVGTITSKFSTATNH